MNPEIPHNPQGELETQIIALLLGELPPDEAAALQLAIVHDPELAKLQARLQQTIDLVRETSTVSIAHPAPTPMRLSEKRREALLQQFKTIRPKEFQIQPESAKTNWIIPAVALVVALLVLSGLFLPSLAKSKAKAQRVRTAYNTKLWSEQAAEPNRADIPRDTNSISSSADGQLSEPAFVANNSPGMTPPPPAPGKSGNVAIALPQGSAPNVIYQNFGYFGEPPVVSGQSAFGGGGGGQAGVISRLGTALTGNEIAFKPQPETEHSADFSVVAANGMSLNYQWDKNGRGVTALADSLQNRDNAGDDKKVPALGGVPVLGKMFRSENKWGGKTDRLGVENFLDGEPNQIGLFPGPQVAGVTRPLATPTPEGSLAWFDNEGDKSRSRSADKNVAMVERAADHFFRLKDATTITTGTGGFVFQGRIASSADESLKEVEIARLQETEKQRLASVEAQHLAEKPVELSLVARSPKAEDLFGDDVAGKETQVLTSPKQSGYRYDLATRDAKEASVRGSVNRKPAAVTKINGTAAAPSLTRGVPADAVVANNYAVSAGKVDHYLGVEATNAVVAVTSSPTLGVGQGFFYKNSVVEDQPIKQAIKDVEAKAKFAEIKQDDSRELGFSKKESVRKKLKEEYRADDTTALKQKIVEDAPVARPVAPAPVPQPEILTRENRFSTFSLNVSDVSFKLVGASLEKGTMPEAGSIRSEEFINAFDYRDPEPPAGVPVAFAAERARYPFAHNRALQRISLKTAALGRQQNRPLNIVLLLDNSGSMERSDRQNIIRAALRVLATQLHPQDTLSVVTFARTARLWVDGVSGDKAGEVAEKVGGLTPQGGTNLEEAMKLAYQTALRHYLSNGINRVVLLTDGAANLGNVDAKALRQKVEAHRQQGVALDCFGIGWEGYNDDLLEVLSRNGDGRYAFINSPEEAATEFAAKLAGALQVAAADVKVQIEFNTNRVTSYRQIGYAKHQLTKEQFRDNKVDAAEIGAAEAGNALYVIEENPNGTGPIATVRVRFKVPGTGEYQEHEWIIPCGGEDVAMEKATPAMKLAMSASAFSEWLAGSPFAGEVTPDRLLGYLQGVPEFYGADGRPKKLEWMIRQAKTISGK